MNAPPDGSGRPALVLHVCTRLNVGGPARHLDGLSRFLPDDLVTEVAAGRAPPEEGQLTVSSEAIHDVPLVRAPRPLADVRAHRRLRQLIDLRAPAVVATHMSKAGMLGRLAGWSSRRRPRTVHTYHGHLLEGYFRPAVRRAVVATEQALARRTDALVAVSEGVRDQLLAVGIGHPDQWHVLPTAIDLDRLVPASLPRGRLRHALGVGADTPLIGAVGRLAPIKDLGVALRATSRLPGVHLALVGDGPSRAWLFSEARRLGIADRVHLTGWLHEIAEVYADLDAVVLTSRNEGTPSALLEAAAAGCPVVATDVGGVGDILDRGRFGALVPPGAPHALATAIGEVLTTPRLGAKRAEEARQHVRTRYDARAAAEAHAALYRRLIASGD